MRQSEMSIKTTDRKCDRGREWRQAQERWGFWNLKKKTVSWDLNSERDSWDSSLEKGSRFLVSPRRDQLGSTKCAARGGIRWKSQHRKKLCFSLLMSKNLKLKKVIKGFVPEPKESRQVFRVFSHSYMRMNITNVVCICTFHMFVSWSYIFGCGYVTGAMSIKGASPSDCFMSYPGHLLGGILPLCRDSVGVVYCHCRRSFLATSLYDVVAYILDCYIVVSEFHLQSD